MHGNITQPTFQIISPTNAQSYLNAARQLYAGMEALSLQPSKTGVACSFLAAQTLECGLKSYLSNNGVAENKLKEKQIRHDLEMLWVQAVQHGLDVSSQPPQWCVILNSSHGYPYYFRYPMGIHIAGVPELTSMVSAINQVLATVENSI